MSSDGGGAVLKTAGSDFEEGAVLEGQRGALESTRSSTPGRCSRGGSADGVARSPRKERRWRSLLGGTPARFPAKLDAIGDGLRPQQ
ncbi:hypothetical protein M6B38_281400 [Iris pallida]|uniref:Uncharacterized protein n=1 Tax=Iris pallida TaxID=29817 RepID=A0AAX6I1T5_IRIPA|nr:hypothetical protein M6B38_281400 [Iris pallida]